MALRATTTRSNERNGEKGIPIMDNANVAAQMALAHRGLGSWAAVARLCGNHPRTGRPHSAAAAWFYGTGSRPVPDEVAEAWRQNVTPSMLKAWAPRQRRPRACIEVSPETAARLRERKLPGETWDETLTRLFLSMTPTKRTEP